MSTFCPFNFKKKLNVILDIHQFAWNVFKLSMIYYGMGHF